jgi:hypothetical protein
MKLHKIGVITFGLLVGGLILYGILQAMTFLILSGSIDDGSPLQYADKICLGQVTFPPDVPSRGHTLQWDADEQKLLVYHPDWGLLIIAPFKPEEETIAFPHLRGRIIDMIGAFLLVREQSGGVNIYRAYDASPITDNPIHGLSDAKLSSDGLQIVARPDNRSDSEYRTILLLTRLDGDEWVSKQEIEFSKAIHDIHGWSESNSLIAITEWARQGLLFRIVDFTNGKVIKESNNKTIVCTGEIVWYLDTSGVIYTGSSRENDNWDLYSERLNSEKAVNLTNTATVDEVSPTLSPDQTRLAYVAKYWDEERRPVQQLFMAEFSASGTLGSPLQLTDIANNFVFNPIWISDNEIFYMVWNSNERSWTFWVISTETLISQTIGGFSPTQTE